MATCSATKKDGSPCSGKPIGSTGLCLAHQPRKAAPVSISASHVNASVGQAAAAVSAGVDPEAQKRLHAALVGVVATCCILVPHNYRPAQNELESFLLPLERIWLRHQPGIGEINEDITDALAAAVVAVNYVARVYLVPKLLSRPAAVPAGDNARADRPAAEPPRPVSPAPPVPNGDYRAEPIGGGGRSIEAMLSRAHQSSVHAGGDGRGFDAGDSEE